MTSPFVITLEDGYQDQFNLDMGWSVNSSAASDYGKEQFLF